MTSSIKKSSNKHTYGVVVEDTRRMCVIENMSFHHDVQCANCGGKGHVYRTCHHPVTSYGLVCFRIDAGCVRYVMVQRKDSLAYVEFIRGKYNIHRSDYIVHMLSHMTFEEQNRIEQTDSFETLWNEFWHNHNHSFLKEFEQSKQRFQALREGYINRHNDSFFNLAIAISLSRQTHNLHIETEFGFPKGRRNINEQDLECAVREFVEETNIPKEDVFIVPKVAPFEENFCGSNNVRYRHTYFLAIYKSRSQLEDNNKDHMMIPITNIEQSREIRAVKWFDANDVLDKLRPHYLERRSMFSHIHSIVKLSLKRFNGEDEDHGRGRLYDEDDVDAIKDALMMCTPR